MRNGSLTKREKRTLFLILLANLPVMLGILWILDKLLSGSTVPEACVKCGGSTGRVCYCGGIRKVNW